MDTLKPHRIRATRAFALAFLVGAGGCNYFRPAIPEPPSGSAIRADYSTPQATLQTLTLALADKARTNGTSAWVGAFGDAYQHQFWPLDVTQWETTSGRTAPLWTVLLEQNFYTQFVALRGDNYVLEWALDEEHDDDEQLGTFHRHYVVTTQTEDGDPSGYLAIGYVDLIFTRTPQGQWLITRWEDRPDPGKDPNDPEQITLGLRRLGTQ